MSIRAKLLWAESDRCLVTISRVPKFAHALEGFVVEVGAKWAVVQNVRDGGYFDGYSAFRIRHVRRVKVTYGFAAQFAQTLPTWPPSCPEGLDLGSTQAVVRTMAAASPLIGIEREQLRSAIRIGVLEEVTLKRTWLLEVDPAARWSSEATSGMRNKDLTLVSIDSLYLQALAAVAGPPPGDEVGIPMRPAPPPALS